MEFVETVTNAFLQMQDLWMDSGTKGRNYITCYKSSSTWIPSRGKWHIMTQITVTIEEQQINALQKLADKDFEGNLSMALRAFLRDNNLIES